MMLELPQALRSTLTWDQGGEMDEHASITVACDMEVFFVIPIPRGSGVVMKILMGCCVSIGLRGLTLVR